MCAEPTLEVTYRHGMAWAAYLFLARESGQRPTNSRPVGSGLVIESAKDAAPLGVEITAPDLFSMDSLNAALRTLGVAPVPNRHRSVVGGVRLPAGLPNKPLQPTKSPRTVAGELPLAARRLRG